MSDRIFVLDEIEVVAAHSAELRKAYIERYMPSARARNMCFEGAWRTPAIDLPDRPTILFFLWSVAGPAEWWGMRLGTARANPDLDVAIEGDEEKTRWWGFVDSIATSRKRTFMIDVE